MCALVPSIIAVELSIYGPHLLPTFNCNYIGLIYMFEGLFCSCLLFCVPMFIYKVCIVSVVLFVQ